MESPEQIRQRLGLKSHPEFEYDMTVRNLRLLSSQYAHGFTSASDLRACIKRNIRNGTGRTTEMILYALSDISRGEKVAVRAANMTIAKDIVSRVRHYAEILGMDPQLAYTYPSGERAWRDFRFNRGTQLHTDHTVFNDR